MRITNEADIDTLIRGAKLLAITAAWSELGYWQILFDHKGPVELSELGGDRRALGISAHVLAHAGLLSGAKTRWTLTPVARNMFERGELGSVRNLEWLSDLGRMTHVLQNGGPVLDETGASKGSTGGVRLDDMDGSRRFLDMLYRRAEFTAPQVADWLMPRLAPGAHVLDLGGGHGRYAECLVARGCRATLFDFPQVIELAKERHGDRLQYRSGDYHEDDLGGPYDAAFLSNVVHCESVADNEALVLRLAKSIKPGGTLAIKDMFIDEFGSEPVNAVFFGITMLYYTKDGRSYTYDDVARWCQNAGLMPPQSILLGEHVLLCAEKPV